MHERCEACNLKYERDRGYFLGSTYINYGWTGMLLVVLYFGLHFGCGFTNTQLSFPLAAVFIGVPIVMWRHARSIWLAMDCVFDRTGFAEDECSRRHWTVAEPATRPVRLPGDVRIPGG